MNAQTEEQMAALAFSGEYSGYVTLVLQKNDVASVASAILERFPLDVPIENALIFLEIMNILAGNVVTELRKTGMDILIGVPEKVMKAEYAYAVAHMICILTKEDTLYKLCLYISGI